ncbi:helix-turn-helix domain-containing protein [Streptomyces hoynatensis]|uniref:XRE family transcriptional regulator n=1 Tax=Streptomyces hoynatensis TaxID=1141874 RepID=A0A3A9YZ13_9ACTN|nr:helix-turn-helix transcriptional regulator [Streptomyces hoynatensis]RKN41165.1 XRE family transcriptional regulator [Streptomyces hoynatensis]
MTGTTRIPGPGQNVAVLRKARGMGQAALARRAGISVSLLSKIEIGDRTLSQGVAASIANALGYTLDEVLGKTPVEPANEGKIKELRGVIRRFDLPGEPPQEPSELASRLADIIRMRGNADLAGVLGRLPDLLADATNHAHAVGLPGAWSTVADVYSAVYWLAARHRWMDLADLAVTKQRMAAERADPLAAVIAARDEAGAFLNFGDFAGGLAVVDRAVVQAENIPTAHERSFGLGILHLRGMTLAGRLKDRAEAARHREQAWRLTEDFPRDIGDHGIHFGPENTLTHVVATSVDMEDYGEALSAMEDIRNNPLSLPATRIGPLHMNASRARLALGDREGALDSLSEAWDAAPQMARVHPHSQELLRVLTSIHRRSNPRLMTLAKRAGIPF